MGIVFEAAAFGPVPGETFPAYTTGGTSLGFGALLFSAADNANESAQIVLGDVSGYSSSLVVEIEWYADNATTGDVVWDVRVAAITANTDSQDISTDSLAAASSVTDSHLGTTSKRLHRASITVSNVDSLADDDQLTIVVRRNTTAANADTMANDAGLVRAIVTLS